MPGKMNVMEDECSRLWDLYHSQVIAHFDYIYPRPNSWRFCSLKPEMLSAIASALSKMRSDPTLFLHATVQPIDIGNAGSPFATSTISKPSYLTCQTRSQSSKLFRQATEEISYRLITCRLLCTSCIVITQNDIYILL
jgi:hypothetical protein